MGIKVANNAFGTLASSITNSATSITLTTGQGARFPTLGAGDYFYATLIDTSNNLEIVKCTARSTDVLTVTRAQENTTARAYSAGDRIEIRITAATFEEATAISDGEITTAKLADSAVTTAKLAASAVTAAKLGSDAPTGVSDKANSSTGYFALPSGNDAQRPGSPAVGNIRYNTTTQQVEAYINGYWAPLAVSWGSYTATYNTPNGGSQTCRFIFDEFGLFVQVGRFSASAAAAIQTTWSSVRGLSTSTAQSATTEFSADWGDYSPSRVRVLGSTNFDSWRNTRTIDWMYGVPSGRQWKNFFTSNNTSGTGYGGDNWSNGSRYGFTCDGVYDGFGRWSNPSYTFMRMSDGNVTMSSSAFTSPTSSAFYWHGSGDAKLAAHATAVSSGQDAQDHTEFGVDDNFVMFYDTYPTATADNTALQTYSSAVWILIKVG